MLGILTREYGIKPSEALTEYSEDEIQVLLSQLPADRLVTVRPKMSQLEIDNKYMEVFCDRDTEKVQSAQDRYILVDQRAQVRSALKKATTDEERKSLQDKYDEITKQIEEAS